MTRIVHKIIYTTIKYECMHSLFHYKYYKEWKWDNYVNSFKALRQRILVHSNNERWTIFSNWFFRRFVSIQFIAQEKIRLFEFSAINYCRAWVLKHFALCVHLVTYRLANVLFIGKHLYYRWVIFTFFIRKLYII